MANFKRRRPRLRTSGKRYDKWKARELEARFGPDFWLGSWPASWDILHHRRPRRRIEAATAAAIVRGDLDPETAVWPLNKRPHVYWW
jgi:hypothetical protein